MSKLLDAVREMAKAAKYHEPPHVWSPEIEQHKRARYDARRQCSAAFSHPDRAEAIVEALEKDGHTASTAPSMLHQECGACTVLRALARAMGLGAEEHPEPEQLLRA